MTSQIIADSIDETYPIAGQDNDSQGFRDNFSIIKDGLATAASEITVLQNNTAKLTEPNDFNGTLISNAQTNRLYGSVYESDTIANSTVIVDYQAGEYQNITITRNSTLRFENWPSIEDSGSIVPVYAKLKIALTVDAEGPAYDVTFTTENGTVKSQTSAIVSVSGTVPLPTTVVDVWAICGETNDVYINVLGNFV